MPYNPGQYFGYGSVNPVFANYSGVVPGPDRPFSSNFPSATPNQFGGMNMTVPGGAGAGAVPWIPPSLFPGTVSGGTVIDSRITSPTLPATPNAPPVHSRNAIGVTPVPATTGAPPQAAPPGAGSWLDQLIGQISGQPFTQMPYLSNSGLPVAIENLLNQQTYEKNLANQKNQQMMNFAVSALHGQGTTAKQDAQLAASKQSAAIDQDLVSRGLTNTTIAPTEQRGVQFDLSRQLQGIDEGTARMLMGLLQSVQNNGPNTGALSEYLRGAMNFANPYGGSSATYNGGYGGASYGQYQPSGISGPVPGWSY